MLYVVSNASKTNITEVDVNMTTKTTYKVGDKVRILNAEKISNAVRDGFKTGGIYNVKRINSNGRPILEHESDILAFWEGELKYIEKVAGQVAKFKVGDKVRVIGEGVAGLPIGTEAKVIEVDRYGDVYLDVINVYGNKAFYLARSIELATQKPTKNQRITALEQTVATLQAEVEALKATKKIAVSSPTMTVKADVDIAKVAESLAKAFEKHSPNERRKAIIAEAKAFVAENLSKNHPHTLDDGLGAWFVSEGGIFSVTTEVDFVINSEKSTVVALVKGIHNKNVRGKGIAKCNPSDVFNADIGKAIALGRALGLDVERFEKAVKPTEFVNGQIINVKDVDSSGRDYLIAKAKEVVKQDRIIFEKEGAKTFGTKPNFAGVVGVYSDAKILDDTEAQY